MASHFKLKKKTDLNTINLEDPLPESDFSLLTEDNKFLQFEFVETEEFSNKEYTIKSGIYTISLESQTMVLKSSGFSKASLLEDYVSTKDITSKINTFFNRIHIYEQLGEDPKRAMLLYGPPGAGKSVTISKICNDYAQSNDTTIVIWPSDKFEAKNVKDFIKRFDYTTNNISRLLLVIEDLGGVESGEGPRRYSESSLLSLLDNVEKTFKVPTMIIATTNYPEHFLENLTDRPQRFDDVMEVKRPNGEFRAKFLEFFSRVPVSEAAKELIKDKKYDNFSVAHVKEVVIRSALYDISLEEAIEKINEQSTRVKKGFKDNRRMGMGSHEF